MAAAPDPGHDLPRKLLEKNWIKCWSKREQRYYFFNTRNNKSVWDMPVIESPEREGVASEPKPHQESMSMDSGLRECQGGKRKMTSEEQDTYGCKRQRKAEELMVPVEEKPLQLKGPFWNFRIESNIKMKTGPPCTMPPPHNEIELIRAKETDQLRREYEELCKSKAGLSTSPKESFNRWLLERKVFDRGSDPMLPSDCENEVSSSMRRELLQDIPIKLYQPKRHFAARKLIISYIKAAEDLITSRYTSSEKRKKVKWSITDINEWLSKTNSSSTEEYQERLYHLHDQCGPVLREVSESSIKAVCIKMYGSSCETCHRLRKKHWELLQKHGILELPKPKEHQEVMETHCSPPQMVVPSPLLPKVEKHGSSMIYLRYNGVDVRIREEHMTKLHDLYQLHCRDDPRKDNFLSRVWCLLRRYQTLFGIGEHEGHGLQGALPTEVFEALNHHFGVTFECFASPLNCYFKQYCSAFPDTDGYFGSRGPFLDFHPLTGSFEANPPFGEELMEAMVKHFENLLEKATDALSFIVFIPDWRNPPTNGLVMMEASRFNTRQQLIEPFEHDYRSGSQHIIHETTVRYRAVHGTLMFFLQNEEGFKKWQPTDDRVQAILDAAKSPEATPKSQNYYHSRKRPRPSYHENQTYKRRPGLSCREDYTSSETDKNPDNSTTPMCRAESAAERTTPSGQYGVGKDPCLESSSSNRDPHNPVQLHKIT